MTSEPQRRAKDGAESVLYSNLSADPVEIYEVKRSEQHVLTDNEIGSPF